MNWCKTTFVALLLGMVAAYRVDAQTPTSCFEIESILVDACGGASEGLNEMLMFHVGPAALNTANMSVTFPTVGNTWTGTCQNATTASAVSTINATITGCGRLIEPVGGVLPAGSRVILFTSTNVNPLAHSFAALDDTLIAIFHCANYTVGNFANGSLTPGLRTTTVTFNPPGCSDVVTYDRTQLPIVNGAQVNFSWPGVPTYLSPGCNAPYSPLNPDAGLPQSICAGGTITLSGSVSPGTRPYLWFGGTGTFSNTTTSLTPTYTLGVGDVGSFWLYLSESSACRTRRDSVQITVLPRPVFSLPADTSICGNVSYTFGPNITGSSYVWSNGPTTQNITATAPGTYTVTLTAANGCTNTDALTISANSLSNVGLPNDTTICAGTQIIISPTVSGATYNWSTGAVSGSIGVSNPGMYTIVVTTANNCVGRDTFNLLNYALPILDLGNDTTICPGNGFTLSADPLGQNPGATFAWSTSATSSSIAVPGQGTYIVTVTSPQSCVSIDTLVVSESSAPPVNLGPDAALCQGDSLTLNAGTGSSYLWSTGATSQSIVVNQAGTYDVTVSFGANCGTSDTMNLVVNALPVVNLGNDTLFCPSLGMVLDAGAGGTTYAWSSGQTTQQITLTTGGTYTVTVTNAALCSSTDIVVVQTGIDPQVNLGPDIRLCPGSSAILDAGAGNTSYFWNTGATTQTITVSTVGTYYVLGTTSCGTDSAAINITISPAPFANAGPDDTLCAGTSMTLSGASAGGATFAWSASSGTFNPGNAVNPVYTADSSASGPVQLILTVGDTCGFLSDTMTLEILPILQMTIILPDTVCYQTPITVSYTGNPTSILWLGNGTFSDSTGNPTVYTPAPGEAGNIVISAQATGQCGTAVFSNSFYAEDTVIANFSWEPALIYPATWVQFNNGTYLPGLPGHWSFGDSFYSVELDPRHQYYNPGTYNVELISYGSGGCNDTAVLALTVQQPDTLVPNVFTPNGDGFNDFFDVVVKFPTEYYELSIFDRWGRRLFVSNSPEVKWNGTLNGSDVPDGVYYYLIEMKPLAGGVLRYNGALTLLR